MVHYHLTNKNLSWAQVRDAGACLLPLQEKVGGGVATFLHMHIPKAQWQQGDGRAMFAGHILPNLYLPAGKHGAESGWAQTHLSLQALSLAAPCWTPAQGTCGS